jgi:transcription elongation GreA/GreB family factor
MLKLPIFEKFRVNETHKKSIIFADYFRLMNLIETDLGKEEVSSERLHHLFLALTFSIKYATHQIPENFVRMNSRFLITNSDHLKLQIRIVYPGEVESNDDYSIYSKLGLICLGLKQGEAATYRDGENLKQVRIEKIFSHEAT